MEGFDVNRFVHERRPTWRSLEAALVAPPTSLEQARSLGALYRQVSGDLVRARAEDVDGEIIDYLNDLVAKSYAVVHARRASRWRAVWRFLTRGYPALVRRELPIILLSASLFMLGGAIGAVALVVDPDAAGVVIPEQHQAWTPDQRIERDEQQGLAAGQSVRFASFLFTHNIKVTFLAFALGITFGLGTALVMFYNGVPIGALAVEYHAAGEGLFFWAWILPHGVPELTAIFIAGGAGLIIGRALWLPGRKPRGQALREAARRAVMLILGTMPVLVLAGIIEGTLSQMHEPAVPYWLKLVFAGLVAVGLYTWLARAGRDLEPGEIV